MTSETTPPVLVVGAGPVGLVLACELARRGVPVRIIDKRPTPTEESRAILVHARSLEMFEQMGVLDALVDSGVRTYGADLLAGERTLAHVSFRDVDSPFGFSVTTAQTETERVVAERLADYGVTVDRGVELVGLTQEAEGVDVTLRHVSGSDESDRFGWVVGTDGAHSTVRTAIGSKLAGSFKGQKFLLGDVDADYTCDRETLQTIFSPVEGALLVFPMVGERLRLIAEIPDEPPREPGAPVDASLERLQAVVDRRVPGMTLRSARWITEFEIHHAQVPTYRVGRVFLAGDAAHVHSPAGGQGMNTGMQDSFNLGWKLALAVRGGIDADALLDSYHAERHPIAARVIRDSTRLTNAGTVHGTLARTLRDTALRLGSGLAPIQHKLSAEIAETDLCYRDSPIVAGRRTGHLQPGDHAPDVAGLRSAWVDALGHTILHFAHRRDGASLGPVAGVRNVVIGAAPAQCGPGFDAFLADDSGAIAQRYGLSGGGLAAVRPDGYLGFLGRLRDSGALHDYLNRGAVTVDA